MSAARSTPVIGTLYRFGPFEVDRTTNELRKFGMRIKLERKPFQLLVTFLDRPGHLVTRAELQHSLWGDEIFVDFDRGLTVAMAKLRAALSDSTENPKYIETTAGEGYRFVAKVEAMTGSSAVLADPSLLAARPDSNEIPSSPKQIAARQPWWSERRAIIAAVLIIFFILSFALSLVKPAGRGLRARTFPANAKVMLVVLPFQNLSNDPSQDYFSDGMTEELSTQLGNANSGQLGVIGRTSAMAYKHSEHTIGQIGKELAVDYVLEGSVRREGNQIRVTAQLVQVSDQAHVWAANYDENLGNLIQLESKLADEIARQVGVSIAMDQPTKSLHILDPEAHEAYLLAQYYLNKRTPAGHDEAVRYLRQAIELDPQYAAAYAELAMWVNANEGRMLARKALDLDPNSGEVQAALGWFEVIRTLDLPAAESTLKRAIQLDPNYAPAHHTYGGVLVASGRVQEAIHEEKYAVQLDPLSLISRASLAEVLSLAGQHDRAVEEITRILAIDPQYPKAHETLGNIYLRRGMYKEAIREYETGEQYGGGKVPELRGYAYARMGNKDQALRALAEVQKDPDYTPDFGTALVEIGLGNKQKALDLLEKTVEQHDDDGLLGLKTDPIFDPLRSDPRFQELLRRMKFPL